MCRAVKGPSLDLLTTDMRHKSISLCVVYLQARDALENREPKLKRGDLVCTKVLRRKWDYSQRGALYEVIRATSRAVQAKGLIFVVSSEPLMIGSRRLRQTRFVNSRKKGKCSA